MKIVYINGSPKSRRSVSGHIISALADKLAGAREGVICNIKANSAQGILAAIENADAIVFVFPLYLDALPSHVSGFLESVRKDIKNAAPGAKVYVIVNNGFYEARQNATAIAIMQYYCMQAGLAWGQAIGVGGGGMIFSAPLGRGTMRDIGQALDALAENISKGETAETRYVEPNFPRFLYMAAGNRGWKRAAKRRGIKARELYRQHPVR